MALLLLLMLMLMLMLSGLFLRLPPPLLVQTFQDEMHRSIHMCQAAQTLL
jgi:hypothetical protein